MNTEDLSGVLRRIRKLLAIAQDSRANPAEAAAAAKQAENIMRKYQVDNAALVEEELRSRRDGVVAMGFVFANMKRDDMKRPPALRLPNWASWIAVPLARLHDCEVRCGFAKSPRGITEAALALYGYVGDVQVCQWTFDYLVGAMLRDVQAWQAASKRSKVDSDSYRKGFVLAVARNLEALKQRKDSELQASVAGRSLVLSKRAAIVDAFGDFTYRPAKTQLKVRRSAYEMGVAAGDKVDVARRAVGAEQQKEALPCR